MSEELEKRLLDFAPEAEAAIKECETALPANLRGDQRIMYDRLYQLLRLVSGAFAEAAAELKAQRERIEALEKEIQQCHAKASCMCGDEMKNHSAFSGHTPVSMYDHTLDQAQIDRDYWEQQAAKNHSQTLEALRDLEGAKEAIKSLQSPEIENELQNVVNALNAPTIAERKRTEKALRENDRLRAETEEIFTAQAAEITRLREAEQQAAYNMLVACANFVLPYGEQLGPMIHDRMLEELGKNLKREPKP